MTNDQVNLEVENAMGILALQRRDLYAWALLAKAAIAGLFAIANNIHLLATKE